jgi:hypothetical protein
MAHLVRAGQEIVNLDLVVRVRILSQSPPRVEVVTTAPGHGEAGSEDYGTYITFPAPHTFVLLESEAREFLHALPSSVTSAEGRGEA